ncbi:MAG: acyl-CoA reductase [Limisphaerales bacterium]
MKLPNYFLADMGSGQRLEPKTLREACLTLKRNRRQYLQERTTPTLIRTLANVAENWTLEHYPIRKWTLERGPQETGFPLTTLTKGIDQFMAQMNETSLQALIQQDLGHLKRLDQPCSNEADPSGQRLSMAFGSELIFHISGGALPNAIFTHMILGILTKSAQLIKCPSGGSFLARMLAHSLYDADPKLGTCLEVAEWEGGDHELETIAMEEAETITATGSDATLASVHQRVTPSKRFLAYGHKVSAALITKGALQGLSTRKLLHKVVDDIVAWNQRGCLSPHVIYVEDNPDLPPIQFAERLADYLQDRELEEPRGSILPGEAARIRSRRSFYTIRAAHAPGTAFWESKGNTNWTVVFEEDPIFQTSCLNRFIYVKRIERVKEVIDGLESMHGKVSTLALAAAPSEADEIVEVMGRWGVSRICPIGSMQQPPLGWRHDGRPALGDLVRWVDWEV